jgi:hypothetical protein
MQRLTEDQRASVEKLATEAGITCEAAAPRSCAAERRRAAPTIMG